MTTRTGDAAAEGERPIRPEKKRVARNSGVKALRLGTAGILRHGGSGDLHGVMP